MNWNELAEKIAQMTPEQQQTNVTIRNDDMDEFFGNVELATNLQIEGVEEYNELDPDHPYLIYFP
jgi:hypothetical protein